MKHKLSAILMAFMLTTPAALLPEATNRTEATTGTTGTTTPLPAQPRLLLPLVAWLLALSARRSCRCGNGCRVATLAVVGTNDSGDGGSHNTSTTSPHT